MKDQKYLADWMEGKITDEELEKIVGKEAFLSYSKIIKTLDNWSVPKRKNTTWEQLLSKMVFVKKEKKVSLYSWVGIAASILIVFGLGIYQINNVKFTTEIAAFKTIDLQDGSKIYLEPNSSIQYNKLTYRFFRKLKAEGAMVFKVSKGSPFNVETKNGTIAVLGTTFKVLDRLNFFKVACFEGKVKVGIKKNEFIITASQEVDNLQNEIKPVKYKWNEEIQTKYATYQHTPLEVVIADLEAIYDIEISFSELNKKMYFSGRYSKENLEEALLTVFTPFHLKAEKIQKNKYQIEFVNEY
ncbi:FecR family protein [Lutibacter oceani]|uniref:FecR family protein n=1 Tax=Lutibacter oceani TaxID=1853311 RepID=A0A3D9RPP8_9FLAO|nr:FecR family protein [Lutibacter oceani]REE81913.1 FecR family protein [Lutibacter oceani]